MAGAGGLQQDSKRPAAPRAWRALGYRPEGPVSDQPGGLKSSRVWRALRCALRRRAPTGAVRPPELAEAHYQGA
eukprot:NODE_4779_length_766_cov_6.161785_g3983_i0.p2 GENE.NODE_4779_length_766_cov_6.161785_g3983_i0~~NODE_4779_length_766_cov_6.161785_g3983_i0.p2  ORF type:complete len:74 (-),score=1.09 NODE_4779_length_766_cov_6.161785_g3983_i0:171-392(-)